VPAYAGRTHDARLLVERALAEAPRSSTLTTRAWLHAVAAEVHALARRGPMTLRSLGRSGELLGHADVHDVPEWLDFYDSSRLRGFEGFSLLTVGRAAEARAALEATLASLPEHAEKQRAVTLADIASTYVQESDIPAAVEVAKHSFMLTARTRYATAGERLQKLRDQLKPWQDSKPVRELDEYSRPA